MSLKTIISRESESENLEQLETSSRAELIAVYGRRRVGKTYLLRSFFEHRKNYFEVTGLKDGTNQRQLEIFSTALSKTFFKSAPIRIPLNWKEAFALLTQEINKIRKNEKIILFFDELPWLARPKSHLLQELDHFWNTQWSKNKNIKIILCGSAASWMLNNLIHAKGGLHNRITASLKIEPFNLAQTEAYIKYLGVHLNQSQILDIYMAFGGIPFYLNELKKGESSEQVIDRVCFSLTGLLNSEFKNLFASLFDDSVVHIKIFTEIANHRYGITRTELLKKVKIESGGQVNKYINELQEAGFITSLVQFGRKTKDTSYRVIDEYSYFYLNWISKSNLGVLQKTKKNLWFSVASSQKFKSWAGYAFEIICYKHSDQIQKALGLSNMTVLTSIWNLHQQAQIDLLFDRQDKTITLCEIKKYDNLLKINKPIFENLKNKERIFKEKTKTRKNINWCFITTEGVQRSPLYNELGGRHTVLSDLFKII